MDYELIKPDAQDKYDPAPFLSYARLRQADKQERDPDIGDVVHFWDMVEARCRAAIVIAESQERINAVTKEVTGYFESLRIMYPGRPDEDRGIVHDETKTGPSWHWPCGGQ